MGVGWGVYPHFLLLESHGLLESEWLYGNGPRHEVNQNLGVPGCALWGGVLYLEHGKDAIPDESPFGEGVCQGEPRVRLPNRPDVGKIFRGVALV